MRQLSDRFPVQVAALCLCASLPAIGRAHEFWIEPAEFAPKQGQEVQVALRVGEHFKGEPVSRKPDRIKRFAAIRLDDSGQLQEVPVTGNEGDDPAGKFVATQPGLYIVVFESNHAHIELDGEKFDAYLNEKGLEAIRKLRAAGGENFKPAREIYSRFAKSLVLAMGDDSGGSTAAHDRALGVPLEILAQFDPYANQVAPDARFSVLVDGKPLPDVQVTAQSQSGTGPVQRQRSTADGEVTFRLTDPGPWLIECTHMRPVPERDDADYESFWASLTFVSPQAAR